MSSSRSGKSGKSSGLRILWIPGGRKSHPKGRYDSTSKRASHGVNHPQRKNEMWSLGGNRAQRDMINAEPDSALLDGPSISAGAATKLAASTTTTIGAVGVATQCMPAAATAESTEASNVATSAASSNSNNDLERTPTTPTNSTASTAPLLSTPHSPEPLPDSSDSMPAKTTTTGPVLVTTTTTTAEIIDENRFTLLGKQLTDEIDIYDFPPPPKEDSSASPLNTSSGTNASTATANIINTATTNGQQSPHRSGDEKDKDSSGAVTPTRRKSHNKSHNNNHQNDVDTIESLMEPAAGKIPSSDLEWIDDIIQSRQADEMLSRGGAKHKKKKKRQLQAKELDQMDGLPSKTSTFVTAGGSEEDEKMVKCLYYTLMCCDCTIS